MTMQNKAHAIHPFAPLNPEGLLPPGLSEEHVASAYRSYRRDLRPKKILKLLGVNDQAPVNKTDLRREMDNPNSRRGQGRDGTTTAAPPLFDVLYLWLQQQQWATNAYDGIVTPAEVIADDRVFLDARQFDAEVKTCEKSFEGGLSDSLERCSFPEALALFALAYALLQPDDADAIVTSLTGLGANFQRFFGTDRESLRVAAAEASSSALPHPSPRPDADVGRRDRA